MLFRTYEPYEEDIIVEKEKDKEKEIFEPDQCFICYESANYNAYESLIKLNVNIYYFKECVCDGFIHKKCLDKWNILNKSCPICRKKLIKNGYYTVSILKYYNGFIVINNLCIYFLKLEKIIHFWSILRALSYILFSLYYCIKIYILMSSVYILSFFFVIFIRNAFS